MATIPQYTSRERLTTETPFVKKSAELEAQTGLGGILKDAGEFISDVTDKMLKISNANAESKSDIETTSDFAVYEDEVDKNPNLDDALNDTNNRINIIRNKVLKNFKDSIARDEYSRKFDLNAIKFKIDLKNKVWKKQMNLARVNTLREMDLEVSNYINALTPNTKLTSRQKISDIMDKAVKMQLFTEEEGYDEVNKVIKSADEATKDLESLKRRKEKEIELAAKEAKNAREQELIQLRVNKDASLEDLILQARADMNAGRIDPKFAEAYINSCKTPPTEKPTTLEGIIKYNELVERNATMLRKEKSWFNTGKVPFEEITKFRADVFNANAKGYIADTQMKDLLSETSKTFYREPIFQNALNQLAAQSKLYATSEAQARIKAEMYGNLITKVIAGGNPREAVQEIIQERLNTELGEAIKIIEQEGRIFAKKGTQRIYSEDGGITWKDEKTGEEIK